MTVNEKYGIVASRESLQKAAAALEANGMQAILVESGEAAKRKLLELIPKGARVMTMTSVTLDTLGVTREINESGNYKPVREDLAHAQGAQKRELGAAPDWAVGSVHAVTESGEVLLASATGSQLPAYAYGAERSVWVVGGQKVVPNLDEGFRRIYEYSLPLEDERARKVYGMGSGINKLLIVNKEVSRNRITVILVNEKLGF